MAQLPAAAQVLGWGGEAGVAPRSPGRLPHELWTLISKPSAAEGSSFGKAGPRPASGRPPLTHAPRVGCVSLGAAPSFLAPTLPQPVLLLDPPSPQTAGGCWGVPVITRHCCLCLGRPLCPPGLSVGPEAGGCPVPSMAEGPGAGCSCLK